MTPMLVLAGFVVLAVFSAGLLCWVLAFFKLAAGVPLVEWSERRPVPWALFDLAAIVGIYLVVSLALGLLLRQIGWLPPRVELERLALDDSKVLTLANSAISLAILAIGLSLIALRTRATWSDFGWAARELVADVRLGIIAFVMLAPPVYLIQAVLTRFWPSKHPLIEMFRESPDPGLFAVLFFAAVIVAPIAEELIFRVLLQGFLEKAFRFRGPVQELLIGTSRPPPPTAADPQAATSEAYAPDERAAAEYLRSAPDWTNPYLSPAIESRGDVAKAVTAADTHSGEPRGAAAFAPIAISSLIFALLHYSHGPDWIPLIFLAAGMGYLYHRTHRLVPSLTVHALLNGLSMWGLWITVYEMPAG